MKKANTTIGDDLRPEYVLRKLRVRRLGPGRKGFAGQVVRIEPDVSEVIPDPEAVNEAPRFLIRITKKNKSPVPGAGGNP